MFEKLKNMFNSVIDVWNNLNKKKKSRIILLTILMGLVISMATVFLNKTQYVVLYTDMSVKESAQVISVLNDLDIRSKSNGAGTVMVDKNNEINARMQLAEQGYPKSGLNYDLYNNSLGITTSGEDKKVMLQYQLQERLASTIAYLKGIKSAIVTISKEEENIFKFKDEISPVSACVVLDLQTPKELQPNQVDAIMHLMVTSIPGLKNENVAIIDTNLNDLVPSNNGNSISDNAVDRYQLENDIEKQLQQKILYLLEPVFGLEDIKSTVNVKVDFDKEDTQITEYSPVIDDEGIPYIVNDLSERTSDNTKTASQENSDNDLTSESLNNRVEKVINYRVNKLQKTIDQAQGNISDISVSILINRPKLESSVIDDVKKLASAAVGIQASKIAVGVMEFKGGQALKDQIDEAISKEAGKGFVLSGNTIIALVAIVCTFIFGILLLNTLKGEKPKEKEVPATRITGEDDDEVQEVYPEETESEVPAHLKDSLEKIHKNEQKIELIKEIQDFVESNPRDIAQIISYWMEN